MLNLESQNKAFMMKLIFKIHSQPSSLWVRVLKQKYAIWSFKDIPTRARMSYFWRNLLKSWDEASLHIKWNVSVDSQIKFWDDFWVGEHGPLKYLSFSPIRSQDVSKPISDYANNDGSWRWSLFQHLLPTDVLRRLSSFTFLEDPQSPPCSWALTDNGKFTTKSAYRVLESLNWDDRKAIWSRVWKLPMAQRIRTFTWLLLKGKLLSNDQRVRRGMSSDPSCSLCQHRKEDLDHIFKSCSFASKVWRKILPSDMCADFFRLDIQSWLSLIIQSPSIDISWKMGVCVTCWKLWEVRNKRIFTDDIFTVDGILVGIRSIVVHSQLSFSRFKLLM